MNDNNNFVNPYAPPNNKAMKKKYRIYFERYKYALNVKCVPIDCNGFEDWLKAKYFQIT